MKLGVIIGYHKGGDLRTEFKKALDLNISTCQLCSWQSELYTKENGEEVRRTAEQMGIEITAFWAGWKGPCEWNFSYGPTTLGLVPPAYRYERIKELKMASDFAEYLGVTDVITHVGYLPENPNDADFIGTVAALKNLANYMKNKGQYFLFETGQETPVTLLRAIELIGTGNLGINFDTANLIMYGKANSVDALDTIGKYVRNTHFKDGEYPTDGMELGVEKPLGQGKANVRGIIEKLKELGYTGPLTIEREIAGEEQIRDIILARDLINEILGE